MELENRPLYSSSLKINSQVHRFLQKKEYYQKKLNIKEKDTNINILEVSSQEESTSSRTDFMKDSDCFIIIFALDDKTSFDAVDNIFKEISQYKNDELIMVYLCGNKSDVENRQITKIEALNYCIDHKIFYFETSAKTNVGIQEFFSAEIDLIQGAIIIKILYHILFKILVQFQQLFYAISTLNL